MRFQFFPLRFEFVALDSLYFPPDKAANLLRGAIGMALTRMGCAQIFEPQPQSCGPSGLLELPRPFVLRARHLNGGEVAEGESFHFDLHIFSLDPAVLSHLVRAVQWITGEGLGSRRSQLELRRISRLALEDLPEQTVDAHSAEIAAPEPVSLDLSPAVRTPKQIRVEFLSPTEVKHDNRIVSRPEFPILFARIRDRISNLRALYGEGPLPIDFRASGEQAAAIRMTACDVRRVEASRRSSRTGQSHSIGGIVGIADYQGELDVFLPYLQAACWTGVGRQTVWGKGEIAVRPLAPGV